MEKIKEKINKNIKLICACIVLLIVVLAVVSMIVNSRVSNKEELYFAMINNAKELKEHKNWEATIKSSENEIKIKVNNDTFLFDTNKMTIWGNNTETLQFDKDTKKIKDINFNISSYTINPWEEQQDLKNYINDLKMKKTFSLGKKTYTLEKNDGNIDDILVLDRNTLLPVKRKLITKKEDGKKIEVVTSYNYKKDSIKGNIQKPEMKGYKYNGEVINKTNKELEKEVIDITKVKTI